MRPNRRVLLLGGTPRRELRPELFVLRDDHGPVEGGDGAAARAHTHLLPQLGAHHQRLEGARHRGHFDGRKLAGVPDVVIVVVDFELMTPREILSGSRRSEPGRDQEALHAVSRTVAVAVPIRDHGGKARGHRFDGCQAERLLNVVRRRCEYVGRVPDVVLNLGIAPIDGDDLHGWAEEPRRVFELLLGAVVREPPREQQVERAGTALGGAFEREIERERMGLGMEGETADEQNDESVEGYPDARAQRASTGGRHRSRRERFAIDSEGDDRPLWSAWLEPSHSRAQIVPIPIEQLLDHLVDGFRGTDEGVPALERRHEEISDSLHRADACGGVRDPTQAEAALPIAPADPGPIRWRNAGIEETAHLGERFRLTRRDPADGPARLRSRDSRLEVREVLRGRGHRDEFRRRRVTRHGAQETGTCHVAPHQLPTRRVESVAFVIDGG